MRKILSLIIAFSLTFSYQVSNAKTMRAEAAFGSPIMDGEKDEIWGKTNQYRIENKKQGGLGSFTGIFSALWDKENIYIYVDVYDDVLNADGALPWDTDCIEVFIDEKNEKNTKYDNNDFQIRVNKDNLKSGLGRQTDTFYSDVKITDFGYSVEMKIPFLAIKPTANTIIGLDLQVTDMLNDTIKRFVLGWNSSSHATSSNASLFGELILLDKVKVKEFKMPKIDYTNKQNNEKYSFEKKPASEISVYIDGQKSLLSSKVVESDYLPCLPVIEYFRLLGAAVISQGNGSIDINLNGHKMSLKENERIADFDERHAMLDVPPFVNAGVLYAPASLISWFIGDGYAAYDYASRTLEIKTKAPAENDEMVLYAKDFGAKGNNTDL